MAWHGETPALPHPGSQLPLPTKERGLLEWGFIVKDPLSIELLTAGVLSRLGNPK